MKVLFPIELDNFGIEIPVADKNAAESNFVFTLADLPYVLAALQKKVGVDNSGDVESLDNIVKNRNQPNGLPGLDETGRLAKAQQHANTLYGDEPVIADEIRSTAFIAGLLGRGYRIKEDEYGQFIFEVDGIAVRKFLTVKEHLLQQVRAINGSLIISNTGTGKVRTMTRFIAT